MTDTTTTQVPVDDVLWMFPDYPPTLAGRVIPRGSAPFLHEKETMKTPDLVSTARHIHVRSQGVMVGRPGLLHPHSGLCLGLGCRPSGILLLCSDRTHTCILYVTEKASISWTCISPLPERWTWRSRLPGWRSPSCKCCSIRLLGHSTPCTILF